MAWKQDLGAVLRKAQEALRKGRGGGGSAESIERTLLVLQGPSRAGIRLGKVAGRIASSARPRYPPNGEIFPGIILQPDNEDRLAPSAAG